jgi:hypothetical protein
VRSAQGRIAQLRKSQDALRQALIPQNAPPAATPAAGGGDDRATGKKTSKATRLAKRGSAK